MSSRWRIGLARFFYNSTIWFSIAFGILPFRYNTKLRRISTSKCSLVYSVCIDALIVIISLFSWQTEDFLEENMLRHNKLMELLTKAIILSNIYTLIAIVVINWREYKSVLYIFNEFAAIERHYFSKHRVLARNCRSFYDYIIWKGVATLLQNLSFIFIICAHAAEINQRAVIVLTLALTLGNVIFLVVLHFYNFVITTYRCLWILHQRLQYLANRSQFRRPLHYVTYEVYEITGIYLRLIKICRRFASVYGQQLLFSIFAIMCANIQSIYYLRVIWSDKVYELSAFDIFYTGQAVLINIFDFWLTISACELALGMARDIAQLLRSFNDVARSDVELEQSLEILVAVCRNNPPEFRLCGLIELNHLTGLKALFTMILYLIYLVQFSYNDF
ncbi:putative gustatory receptor 22a [Zeugodacus cucurbitae]|uniref:putative gustatory receptor 22a n=1 Tax=Zeugodacus cucurbitae TaxID=28588 RepID=UPI0023D9589E|nr:putative gustatory receptor 22a [Zeugodacus cucurbitae]